MKKILAAVALLLTAHSLFALPDPEKTDWNLSVEPLFGMRYGELGEYVFLKNSNYSDDKLSELNWEYKPEIYLGAAVHGGWKAIGASAYVTGGIPRQTGSMYDSDWRNVQYGQAESVQYKTNYSESDNFLNSNWTWGVKGGYTFKPWSFFELTPFVAFDMDYKSFTAKEGTAWYGNDIGTGSTFADGRGPYYPYDDTKHNEELHFDGNVITYSRYTYLLWLGLHMHFIGPYGFIASLGVQVSPYMYSDSLDKHCLTNNYYDDVVWDTFCAYRFSAMLGYRFTERITLSLQGDYFFTQTLKGDDYSSSNGKSYKLDPTVLGGADEWYVAVSLSLRYTFF